MRANKQAVNAFLSYQSRFIVRNSTSGHSLIPAFYQLRAAVGSDALMDGVCDAQCDSSRHISTIEGSVAQSENRRVALTVDEKIEQEVGCAARRSSRIHIDMSAVVVTATRWLRCVVHRANTLGSCCSVGERTD